MKACLESKEPTSLEVQSKAEHEEVPKEGAAVKPIGALKKLYGGWDLALRCCGQPKKETQGSGGSQKKLTAARRGITHCAVLAQRKGSCRHGQGKDKAVPRTQKGWTFRTRHWMKPEGINGIRNQGSRQQLHLRKDRTTGNGVIGWSRRKDPHLGSRTTFGRIFRKTVELEIAKQIVGTSIRLWKMSIRTLWRGQPSPK
jgi:hypothetical protein